MIRRFSFGKPFPTGAIVQKTDLCSDPIPYFKIDQEENRLIMRKFLSADEMIFGLGQSVHGINKRGHLYRSWNSDIFNHSEDQASLYGSHNFLIFFRQESFFGIFIDDPGMVTFDLGETSWDEAVISSENGNLDIYILENKDLKSLVHEFRQLIGPSYIPPRWAFGYIQSRWGYADEKEAFSVVENHRSRKIPLDGLCLDIDYMEEFKNFTWNKSAFPDIRMFVDRMRKEHIHIIPIIDAGIRVQNGYAPYDSGMKRDVFCKKEDGSIFTASVWPGNCCFPDFLNEEARNWFGDLYQPFLKDGIEGFWNDMNEPALFFTEESLNRCFQTAEKQKNRPDDYEGMWNLAGAFNGMANNQEDYQSFYHQTEQGRVRHDQVHNLYGAGMTRATADGIRSVQQNKRYLLFSRSSFIGAHRDGGIWQGDNFSWWSHIKLAMQMLPGLNMCGFLYTGCDLGGFGKNTTEDLLARFLQLGVFLPLMRNHSALHTREQEIYRFKTWSQMKDTVTVRYALLPYLYSEFMKAALRNEMYFRPLAFDYQDDPRAVRVEDQLMLGEDCMIAPVYEQNASGRYVYLPEDMLMIRFRSSTDYDLKPLEKGDHYLTFELNEFPLFVRKNRMVLLCSGGDNTDEIDENHLKAICWGNGIVTYDLYRDDGIKTNPILNENLLKIEFNAGDKELEKPLVLQNSKGIEPF